MSETTISTKPNTAVETPAIREESRFLTPAVDIFETEQGLCLIADMPGVEKEGISVRVDNGILTLEGRPAASENMPHALLEEFQLMPYYRQFQLGEAFDTEKISATLTQGVLTVSIPKPEKTQPRQIEVRIG
jgi:HSP20 family protein